MDSESPTWTGRLIALVFGVVVLAAGAEVALRILMPNWQEFYSNRFMRAENVPGFGVLATGHPGFDDWFAQNNGDFRIRLSINDAGLRDDEPPQAANGRVWVIGDSMAFGWGVETAERYTEVAGQLTGLPVYNVAAPGADVCGYQALAARMPKDVAPRAVIVGLILENDSTLYDCAAQAAMQKDIVVSSDPVDDLSFVGIKHWLLGHSALYNFLAVNLKRVDAVRRMLIALGIINDEHAYKRFFADDQIDAVAESTVAELSRLRHLFFPKVPFAVLIAPARFELAEGDTVYRRLRLAVNAQLAARDIDAIDPFNAFREAGFQPTHFLHDGHWSELGHRIAAEAVAEWLRAHPGS